MPAISYTLYSEYCSLFEILSRSNYIIEGRDVEAVCTYVHIRVCIKHEMVHYQECGWGLDRTSRCNLRHQHCEELDVFNSQTVIAAAVSLDVYQYESDRSTT